MRSMLHCFRTLRNLSLNLFFCPRPLLRLRLLRTSSPWKSFLFTRPNHRSWPQKRLLDKIRETAERRGTSLEEVERSDLFWADTDGKTSSLTSPRSTWTAIQNRLLCLFRQFSMKLEKPSMGMPHPVPTVHCCVCYPGSGGYPRDLFG